MLRVQNAHTHALKCHPLKIPQGDEKNTRLNQRKTYHTRSRWLQLVIIYLCSIFIYNIVIFLNFSTG